MKVSTMKGSAARRSPDPASAAGAVVAGESVALAPIPLAAQPTAYIREAWAKRPYGTTASAEGGGRLRRRPALRAHRVGRRREAERRVPGRGRGSRSPAVANRRTLGDAKRPVGLWYWQHGRDEALNLTSHGPGVVPQGRRRARQRRRRQSAAGAGRWCCRGRPRLRRGKLGVVVWNGSNEERAGLGRGEPGLARARAGIRRG